MKQFTGWSNVIRDIRRYVKKGNDAIVRMLLRDVVDGADLRSLSARNERFLFRLTKKHYPHKKYEWFPHRMSEEHVALLDTLKLGSF